MSAEATAHEFPEIHWYPESIINQTNVSDVRSAPIKIVPRAIVS